MAGKATVYEDPSVRNCAVALVSEAIGTINATLQADPHGSFWQARDSALSAAADGWVASYGRECADRAVRGLHALAPNEVLEADTKAIRRDARVSRCRADLAALDPTRDTWLNRAWISLTGYRLYSVVFLVAAIGVTLTAGGVGTAQAASGASDGRAWRALAVCGVSRPGPGRDRACRQFNSAERSGFRGYDAPAGTPRSWELPRNYELPN